MLTRSDREQELSFTILGGIDHLSDGGIYVQNVEPDSMAEREGLKQTDEASFVNWFDLQYFCI